MSSVDEEADSEFNSSSNEDNPILTRDNNFEESEELESVLSNENEDFSDEEEDDEEEEEEEEEEEDGNSSVMVDEDDEEEAKSVTNFDEDEMSAQQDEEEDAQENEEEDKKRRKKNNVCEVCEESEIGRRALRCRQCAAMYHTNCFRKKFNKLINANEEQWICPDCQDEDSTTTIKKQKLVSTTVGSEGKETPAPAVAAADTTAVVDTKIENGKSTEENVPMKIDEDNAVASSSNSSPTKKKSKDISTKKTASVKRNVEMNNPSQSDENVIRVVDAALRAGKKFNMLIMERTEEMMQVTHNLMVDIDSFTSSHKTEITTPTGTTTEDSKTTDGKIEGTLAPPSSSNEDVINSREISPLLRKVQTGMGSLQDYLQQLQFLGVQTEVDLIKEVQLPPPSSSTSNGNGSSSKSTSKKSSSSSNNNIGQKNKKNLKLYPVKRGKTSASRLYTSRQIMKLEEWYHRCSRPESVEIHSMHRVINNANYSDRELQPDGISVKQIRIWFDNRRAKERLDYMRLKMKSANLKDMDVDAIKKLKAEYIDEAKEVLEERVSQLRESGFGSIRFDEEEDTTLPLAVAQEKLDEQNEIKNTKKKGPKKKSKKDKEVTTDMAILSQQRRRIRIDYIASVRKVVKDAREAGKKEDEIKELKKKAMDEARDRLFIPSTSGGTESSNSSSKKQQANFKTLNKEELTHVKLKILKLLEDDAKPEELLDMIEFLHSVVLTQSVLVATKITSKLKLVMKAHRESKELFRETKKLVDKHNYIIENGDPPKLEEDEKKKKKKKSEDVDGSSPSKDSGGKRTRVKFTLQQLYRLEKYYQANEQPSKEEFDVICRHLNSDEFRDMVTQPKPIDFKQIRCWFYKRRSSNQPPVALATSSVSSEEDLVSSNKSTKGLNSSDAFKQGGRIFNQDQLGYVVTEYESNPKPKPKRIEDIRLLMNKPPYLHEGDTGITRRQIKTWFSNRRAKERLDYIKEKVKQAEDTGLADAADIEKVKELAELEHKDIMEEKVSKGTVRSSPPLIPGDADKPQENTKPTISCADDDEEEDQTKLESEEDESEDSEDDSDDDDDDSEDSDGTEDEGKES